MYTPKQSSVVPLHIFCAQIALRTQSNCGWNFANLNEISFMVAHSRGERYMDALSSYNNKRCFCSERERRSCVYVCLWERRVFLTMCEGIID